MQLNPTPAQPARLVTTSEGKFLNLDDMKRELLRDNVMDLALAMLKVGHDKGDDPRIVMRHVVGSFIRACAGEDHQ